MRSQLKLVATLTHPTRMLQAVCCAAFAAGPLSAAERQTLVTPWAKEIEAESVLPEHPRPQLVRNSWRSLNGEWEFTIAASSDPQPERYASTILVPFPIESYLSDVGTILLPNQRAWYRREFEVDESWRSGRVLLHFGAVDWQTEVWVNGVRLGEHRGGYDPFSFDVTEHLSVGGRNVVVVGVQDPTGQGEQPRGKQSLSPGGIWYTPVSGIWQTVWIESVPVSYVDRIDVTPDLERSSVGVQATVRHPKADDRVEVLVKQGDSPVATASASAGRAVVLELPDARPWSPEDPHLYDLEVRLTRGDDVIDGVSSYFGMRSIRLGKDGAGQTRILLNGEPVFQLGPLDQGYWPDGLYTAPTDAALRHDIEIAKRLGFNMIRKHVKVEPARWYYWCDRLGMLVWQDMPNGGAQATWPADGFETKRTVESSTQYRRELRAMVDALRCFPCVVVWVPFNEAWGQFETRQITQELKAYDPTRLVVSASGGNDFGCGDVNDDHFYPGPGSPPAERDRAAVLGEFGGLGLPIAGHTQRRRDNWGYRSYQSADQLTDAYVELIDKLRPLARSHLSAAVYTQIADVEVEVNGLMTYDRAVVKPDANAVGSANRSVVGLAPAGGGQPALNASTLAWWRFETGEAGQPVGDLQSRMGAIAARDFSGRNNHLFAFARHSAPSIARITPAARMKLSNTQALDDRAKGSDGAATRDLYTNPTVARTHMDLVDRFPLSSFTIEASFCPARVDVEQVVLAKEESDAGKISPILQIGLFGSPPTIGVEMVDESGGLVTLSTEVRPGIDQWRHLALTCEDGEVTLLIRDDQPAGEYRVSASTRISGSLAHRRGTWVVGRGSDRGAMARDFVGFVDEVRISTKKLTKDQLLFTASDVANAVGRDSD